MKTLSCVLLALLGLLCGCSSPVPSHHLTGNIGGVPFNITNPQQSGLKGLRLNMHQGTNYFSLEIDEYHSENDPQVIDKASAGRVAEINALGDIAGKIAEKAVAAGAKSVVP